MATVTKSIGATGRDYTTIDSWESFLDDASEGYADGDDALGQCYADSDFDGNAGFTLNGGGTIGLDSRTLSAAPGERHDGTANSGVRILRDTDAASGYVTSYISYTQIDSLEYDANEKRVLIVLWCRSEHTGAQRMLIHGARTGGGNNATKGVYCSQKKTWICNNIVYNFVHDQDNGADAMMMGLHENQNDVTSICNNTVYGVVGTESTGRALVGIKITNGGGWQRTQNNISMGTVYTGSADPPAVTPIDFTSGGTADKNMSSDDTARGTTNYRNETAADIFVSVAGGAEDLMLKSGTDAIGNGNDLGTSFSIYGNPSPSAGPWEHATDITGRDRDAEGDTWDLGAAQFVESTTAGSTQPILMLANTAL